MNHPTPPSPRPPPHTKTYEPINPPKKKFDRLTYQRNLMRARRAKQREANAA